MIILSGKKRSGKDTVADMLLKFDNKWSKYAIADGLKEFAIEILKIFGNDTDHISDCKDTQILHIKKEINMRELLQKLGDATRKIDKNIWLKYLDKKIEYKKNVIISDVRYYNEMHYLKNKYNNVKHIRIINNKTTNNDVHESEKINFNEYDFLCENNGTLIELRKKVEKYFKTFV